MSNHYTDYTEDAMVDFFTELGLCVSCDICEAAIDRLESVYKGFEIEPVEVGKFYLNEYLANRAYGGPEEGGWWYNTGVFVECKGIAESRDDAVKFLEELQPYIDRRRETQDPVGSVACDGYTVVVIERAWGADYPKQRPYFE